ARRDKTSRSSLVFLMAWLTLTAEAVQPKRQRGDSLEFQGGLVLRLNERYFDRPAIESCDANRLGPRRLRSRSDGLFRGARSAGLRLFDHLLQFAAIERQREFH